MSNARNIADSGHQLKAWVNFDGELDDSEGSLSAGENNLIIASYNVTSVRFNGVGDYQVNFSSNAIEDEKYCAVLTCSRRSPDSAIYPTNIGLGRTRTASSLDFHLRNAFSSNTENSPDINVAIFR